MTGVLYNLYSRELPARVARQRSKVIGFNFDVIYELPMMTP